VRTFAEGREPGLAWLVVAATLPTAAAWAYFVVLRDHPAAPAAYAAAKLVQFALPVAAWLLASSGPRARSREPARGDRRNPRAEARRLVTVIAIGLATGAALSAGVLASRLLLAGDPALDLVGAAVAERVAGYALDSPARYLAFALFLSLVHSGLEEYYWRWFLLGRLRTRLPALAATTLSSLAFTAHHVVVVAGYVPPGRWPLIVAGSLGVFVGGLVWGWLYLDHRGLLAPWLSHALVDVAVLALGWQLMARS
jgi:membrane protease YdiL (CAAX protease family)